MSSVSPVMAGFRLLALFVALALCGPLFAAPSEAEPAFETETAEKADNVSSLPIWRLLTEPPAPFESVLAVPDLVRFYEAWGYKPVWIAAENRDVLLRIVSDAGKEGLDPSVYRPDLLDEHNRIASGKTDDSEEAALRDIFLTNAFLRYARDVRIGRLSPRKAEGPDNWKLETPTFDPVPALEQALRENTLSETLTLLPPPHKEYGALRDLLVDFRARAAATTDWPTITLTSSKIEVGSSNAQIPVLRQRLRLSGELPEEADLESVVLDEELVAALKKFQEENGLLVDGVLGKRTVAMLNMTPHDRVRQIIANMERWRWVPRDLEPTRLVINIAGAWLELYDEGEEIMSMRVVVGTRNNKTPTLRSRIVSLSLNPPWTLPYSIASKEILPKLKKNPNYLNETDMYIVNGDEYSEFIDWSQYTQKTFPYTLRQRPGPRNPLGRIKFNMPNSDDIYLHDTPGKGSFARADRALSHGCVRLQRPIDLALYTLRDQTRWNRKKLEEAIASDENQFINVRTPTPVYLLYWTVWKDAEGNPHFRDDLYGRDASLLSALSKIVPSVMEN